MTFEVPLERRLIDYLSTFEVQLFSCLPFKLPLLLEKLRLDGYPWTLSMLESVCIGLSTCLPNGLVSESRFEINPNSSGPVHILVYFDVVILNQWLTTGQEIAPIDIPAAEKQQKKDDQIFLLDLITDNSSYLFNQRAELESLIIEPSAELRLMKERVLFTPSRPFTELCSHHNRNECLSQGKLDCLNKIHFEPIISPNTDLSIGDCSYLDTCYKAKGCKYVHYRIVYPDQKVLNNHRQKSQDQYKNGISIDASAFYSLGERMSSVTYSVSVMPTSNEMLCAEWV